MKKVIKRSLIGVGIIISLLVMMNAWMGYQVNKQIKTCTPIETQKITNEISSVKDKHVNIYFIKHQSGYIAIDAGMDQEEISKELKKVNIKPEMVTAVLLTHSDQDHVGGINLFKNAVVYLSEIEEQMINGSTPRFLFFKNKLEREYTTVKDQQILNISGLSIKAISTSGHTPGSISYLVDKKYLFTGDALSIKKGQLESFIPMFTMDMDTHLDSIAKLKKNTVPQIDYIFSAHHGYLKK